MTLLHLCSGKNKEGYHHALINAFEITMAPGKGSLSKFRKKISYLFFADQLNTLLSSFKRPTWRGLHVYATDGFEAAIPRTKAILNENYRGRRMISKGQKGETYYPHLYMVHTYDVLSKTTKAMCFSAASNEIKGALENLKRLGRKSLTIYDRFYSTLKIMNGHFQSGNYFMVRCRKGYAVPKAIIEFFKSNKSRDSFLLSGDPDKRVYLYKVKNKKQKELMVIATNKKDLGIDAVIELYRSRWEVENSFRDLVETVKLEQWHAKDINGIAQEIYMRLWIMNFARIHQFTIEKLPKTPFAVFYKRSNFKLVLDFIIDHWGEIFKKCKKILQKLKIIILRTTERRKRYSRLRPRQIRFNPSNYKAANIIFDATVENA